MTLYSSIADYSTSVAAAATAPVGGWGDINAKKHSLRSSATVDISERFR